MRPVESSSAVSGSLPHEGYERLTGVGGTVATRLRQRVLALAGATTGERIMVSGAYRRVWGIVEALEDVAILVKEPGTVARARQLLGPDMVLHNVCANIVEPGAPRQFLHADQQSMPTPWPHPTVMTAVWMLEDFAEHNAATRVVPGTHRFGGPPPYGTPLPPSIPVSGRPGQVLVMDGRVWHHAGGNRSAAPRVAILVTYARPEVARHPRFEEADRALARGRLAPLRAAERARAMA